MSLVVTHTTAADGTFSTAGAAAWNATHTIAGTVDLATETTGTINLLTQTSGAVANRLMYGGASGQVAQSSNLTFNSTSNQLAVGGSVTVASALIISAGSISKISSGGFSILGNTPSGTGSGGAFSLIGGNANISGDGGGFYMQGGNAAGATGSGWSGGSFDMNGGAASSSATDGVGGYVSFAAGGGFGANSTGGSATLYGGAVTSSTAPGGTAGAVSINGGACYGTTGTPGDIQLLVGAFAASGNPVGNIVIGSIFGTDDVAVATNVLRTNTKDLPVIVDGVQRYIRLYS